MQNLQIKDEEFDGQITALWETLFSKYVHIQPIWILYLDHKLKSDKFNATALRLVAQQSIQTLKVIIHESNRPQLITHYKKIYLELLQQICFYESEMGFKERALGVYQSLSELNIFSPLIYQRTSDIEQKLQAFQQYWEEYRNFKTGDLQSKSGWKDQYDQTRYENEQANYENIEFIGLFGSQVTQELTSQNPFQQYIMRQKFVKQRWRPSNLTYDQEYIQFNMDSLVLYEDLQNYLYTFNDIESKLNIVSYQLEQLGYPPLFIQQMNTFYMAQVCYSEIKKQLEFKQTIDYNLMINDLFYKYTYMFQKFNNNATHSEVEKLIYIRRLLMHLHKTIQNEITLSYYLMIEGLIYLKKEYFLSLYLNSSIQGQEIEGAQSRIKQLLKQYGEKYIILWIIYAELEVQKTKKEDFMEKIYQQILQFGKSKKQKLIILYYYAQSYLIRKNFQKLEEVLKKNLYVLLNDTNDVSLNLMKIKIRNEYIKERGKNKIQIIEKLEKQKLKQFNIFNFSKKFLLQNIILILEFVDMGHNTTIPAQQEIDSHLIEIESDYLIIKSIFFQDPETKISNLTRQQGLVSLMLTNFLRYVECSGYSKEIKDDISKKISSIGLKNNPNSLIFYKNIVALFQEKGVYFLKFQQTRSKIIEIMNDQNFFQSTQVAWMILILLQNADKHEDPQMFKSKLGYLFDFLKQQSKKEVSQIYCESKDQEMFEAFINIVYNFYLEKILIYVSKYIMSVEKYIQLTYRAIKKFPFSITLYNKLLKELTQDQQESLKILSVIEEKELKTFALE